MRQLVAKSSEGALLIAIAPTSEYHLVWILAELSVHHFISLCRLTKTIGQDLRHRLLSHMPNAKIWKAANNTYSLS